MATSGSVSERLEVLILGRRSDKRDISREQCAIYRCTDDAKMWAHVWVSGSGRGQHCYTVPVCKKHTTNPELTFPDYLEINKDVVPEQRTSREKCECSRELKRGTVYSGSSFSVTNVKGSTIDKGSKLGFWRRWTGEDTPDKCQILDCRNKAEHGGHMWVKGRDDFCFILPICREHNTGAKKFNHPTYKLTRKTACLVVRAKRDICGCPPSGCKK